ncbi:ionic transporter y4hA [Microbispora sp. ATCC PTA-5024]|nr:ionic transporter y4hA [Microbispora sp. ATCC PTA-5024]
MRVPRWLRWRWTLYVPAIALITLALTWGRALAPVMVVVAAVFLAGAVLAAVHHAEMIAHRVGEPFGSLVLAVAVTVIEVALIVSLMASGGPQTASLARDTVYAAVMITCNGILGLSLLIGALRRRLAVFNAEGTGGALATVATLATLSLVLPSFTTSSPGPAFTPVQLAFAGVVSLALYGLFVLTQTVRHRDYFLPVEDDDRDGDEETAERPRAGGTAAARGGTGRGPAGSRGTAGTRGTTAGTGGTRGPTGRRGTAGTRGTVAGGGHAVPPSLKATLTSLVLLPLALVAVVGLAKVESPSIEVAVKTAGLPQPVVGVVIAMLVLLPETLAAVRAARRDRIQTSLNLALGSAMASIGLTIPVIAVASLWMPGPLVLGLAPTHVVLLGLTIAVGTLTVVPGRATLLQGAVHLTLLAAFVFLAVRP